MSFEALLENYDRESTARFVVSHMEHVAEPEGLDLLGALDYDSKFFECDGHQLHYLDSGPGRYRKTALCLHSCIGWAYAYRNIIPHLQHHGYRVIALDLLGFGLSDKANDVDELSLRAQSRRIAALIEALDLEDVTLIGHEMGASVAAQIPQLCPERVDALIAINPATRLPEDAGPGLHLWQTLLRMGAPEMGSYDLTQSLSAEDFSAYQAPHQTVNGTLALEHFQRHIVLEEGDPDLSFLKAGYRWLAGDWSGRSVVLVGDKDPVFGLKSAQNFRKQIGCAARPVVLPELGSHPLEESPECIERAFEVLFAA